GGKHSIQLSYGRVLSIDIRLATQRQRRATKRKNGYNAVAAPPFMGARNVASRREDTATREKAPSAAHRGPVRLARPARPRRRADRRGAPGARHRARLCAGEAVSARAQRLSRGAL